MHIGKDSYKKTKGCIALKREHLIMIISKIKKNTKIKIN
jgi:L,D-peptidoglycan transpeptidase YkuD (ErfK/YbiS/YcfS/YnhG family)